MENEDPKIFQDVKVFAGNNFMPAADVTYRNLVWENIGRSGVVKKNTVIGTIPSWGPQFRVSFDMKINSYQKTDWTSILDFKGNGGESDRHKHGDRIPTVLYEKRYKALVFASSVNGDGNYHIKYKVEFKKWYNIIIEQKSINKKVRIVEQILNKTFLTGLLHCHN